MNIDKLIAFVRTPAGSNTGYDSPNRVYHNWNHIIQMTELYFRHINQAVYNEESYLAAIAFHDYVYHPNPAEEHEYKSASEAVRYLLDDWIFRNGRSNDYPRMFFMVYNLIMSTNGKYGKRKLHPDDANFHIECMYILDYASALINYQHWKDSIREECRLYGISDEVFREKRKAFLEALSKDVPTLNMIYNWIPDYNLVPDVVQDNIRSELSSL